MGKFTGSVRAGFHGELANTPMLLSAEETRKLAERNHRLMMEQQVPPPTVIELLGDVLPLCPVCARLKPSPRHRTCARTACANATRPGRPPGTPASPEFKAAQSARQRGRRHGPDCSHCQQIRRGGAGWQKRFGKASTA